MSKGRILVITGSRSLNMSHGGSMQSESWAKQLLRTALFGDHRPTFLVHGDCPNSPDRWAHELAMKGPEPYIQCLAFNLDGWIYLNDGQLRRWRDLDGRESNPLRRNDSQVTHCAKARDDGWDVRLVALIAPWAKTHGTEHTVGLARKAGFRDEDIIELTCPSEMAGVVK